MGLLKKSSILAALALLASLIACAAQSLTDPHEILEAHYEAMGGLDRLKAVRTKYFEASVSIMNMEGTVKSWEDLPDRKRQEVDLGVMKMTRGDNGETSWIVDPNGKLQIEKDEATLKKRQVETLLETYEHLNPQSEHFTVTFEGTEMVGEADCYIIAIADNISEDVRQRYINSRTFLLEKAVDPQDNFEVHTLLSDYRLVDGIQVPFRREAEVLPIGQKQIIQVTEYQINVETDRSLFDPPGEDVEDFEFIKGETAENILFDYILDHLYIDVEINGEKRRWVLDSGASATVVDSTYAAELELPPVGQAKAVGAGGSVNATLVTLPALSLQGIRVAEQRVGAIPLRDLFGKRGIDIVGVLGYDFLSRFVTRIDYANQKISFFHPKGFKYTGDGTVIDAPLTNRLFSVPMTVNDRYSGNWTLDIGASVTAFQYAFAEENELLDLKGVERMVGGAGGHLKARISEFESINIGGYRVTDPVILIPLEGMGAFSLMRGVGVLGNNVLRRFVVYLDYNRQQIILEKGDDFEREFPRDKSGLSVILTPEGDYEVFFVSEGTPADEAGFIKGDLVKSINGIGIAHFEGPVAVADLFREEPGTEYEIEVLRDGEPRKLKLKLRDLY
jgi:hypothetical protein